MAKFPGVYAQVINNSYNTSVQGSFTCGLVGTACRGPFNTAIQVNTLSDFVSNFGPSIAGSYLSYAVSAITAFGNQISVTRVGRQYSPAIGQASGSAGGYNLFSSTATNVSAGQYLRVTQVGLPSTNNTLVQSTSTGTVTLVSTGVNAVPLAATYTAAAVLNSTTTSAAAPAEVQVVAPVYGAVLVGAGTALGTKGQYSFTVTGNASLLSAGSAIKLVQTGYQTTREAVVASVSGNVVYLITTANTSTGQQAVALQDSYTAATIYVQTGTYTPALFLAAATPGTWANSTGASNSGLVTTISPGSGQDTKKLLIYLNGALVESYDNLTWSNPLDPNYWVTVLSTDSYLVVRDSTLLSVEPPANTLNPWLPALSAVNVSTFAGGSDGSNVQDSDIIGTLDINLNATGLKVFADPNNYDNLYVLAAPGFASPAVHQALVQTAGVINAFAVLDTPDTLTGQQANDWVNGQGAYAGNARLDNFRGGYYWDWTQQIDPFTGLTVFVPPSVNVLSAMARTFNQAQLWFASAGETRGTCPIATAVRYPRVSQGTLNMMQGNGNVLNPILLYRSSSILIWGDLTSQRSQSALNSIAVVHLCNYLVKNMSAIARRYIFDPNDPTLASQLTLEYNNLLQQVKKLRGISQYTLAIIQTPNLVSNFSLTVNLNIVPVLPVYEIDLNIIVNQQGATLNTIAGN